MMLCNVEVKGFRKPFLELWRPRERRLDIDRRHDILRRQVLRDIHTEVANENVEIRSLPPMVYSVRRSRNIIQGELDLSKTLPRIEAGERFLNGSTLIPGTATTLLGGLFRRRKFTSRAHEFFLVDNDDFLFKKGLAVGENRFVCPSSQRAFCA